MNIKKSKDSIVYVHRFEHEHDFNWNIVEIIHPEYTYKKIFISEINDKY